jgi:threonine synthase
MFNGEASNVRAYAVDGSFDDCQRLAKTAFADPELSKRANLTSANSINIGRLLPQMIYYVRAVSQLARPVVFSTPSGNFGNLTAGLMVKRAGLAIERFVAATNVNDVVPAYLETGRFEPRQSIHTLANAMDVGNPSNFDRLMWLYGGDHAAIRRDIAGSRHDDAEVSTTIREVYERTGYLLDPHSAIAYLGLKALGRGKQDGTARVFLATAHPAKFAEIVEPIIGQAIPMPAPLVEALSRRGGIMPIDGTFESLEAVISRQLSAQTTND